MPALARVFDLRFAFVESAQDPHEALKTFRQGDFDLVITDKVMADMNGEQLAVEIKRVAPQVPVILLTGFGNDKSFSPASGAGAIDLVLGKPLSRTALRSAIAEVILKHPKSVEATRPRQ